MNEYTYNEIDINHTERFKIVITQEMEDCFRHITGDLNPMHSDDEFVKEVSSGKFKKHICFGMLTASLYSTFAGMYLPGKYSLIHSLESVDFKMPVYVGDELTVSGIVKEKQDGLNLIIIDIIIRNQDGKVVSKTRMKNLVQK